MKSLVNYSYLVSLIRKVHFKLLLLIHHDQVVRYRKEASNNIGFSEAVKSSIKSCIQEAVSNINGQKKLSLSKRYNLFKTKNNRLKNVSLLDENKLTELAQYFKDKNGQAMLNSIEGKLEKSTEDHVFAAIRHARQGDEHNAQMHADIAGSSCDELSHFMTKERHLKFVSDMKRDLQRFKLIV